MCVASEESKNWAAIYTHTYKQNLGKNEKKLCVCLLPFLPLLDFSFFSLLFFFYCCCCYCYYFYCHCPPVLKVSHLHNISFLSNFSYNYVYTYYYIQNNHLLKTYFCGVLFVNIIKTLQQHLTTPNSYARANSSFGIRQQLRPQAHLGSPFFQIDLGLSSGPCSQKQGSAIKYIKRTYNKK